MSSNPRKVELRLDWASHAAAKHACERWHYAGVLPTGKLVKVGVWEDGSFRGVVIFSRGASPHLGRRWNLDHTEICELTRVAMRSHQTPVSRILAIAVKMLRSQSPGLRLVLSFADPSEGHHGGVYQAAGWTYTGMSASVDEYFVGGRWRHKKGVWYGLRAAGAQGKNLPPTENGKPVPWRVRPGKHRYVYPLDPELRPLVAELAQPYPKRESKRSQAVGV